MYKSEVSPQHLGARLDGIAHVLRDKRLVLPLFQRPYSWTLEQVRIFWNDLRGAMLLPNPDYFLGTLLLSSQENNRTAEVIDGQQRLATTALLLAALRDEFRDAGEIARSEAFQSEFLSYMDLNIGAAMPRLVLNNYDNSVFQDIALGRSTIHEDLAPSTKRLLESYEYIKKEVKNELRAAESEWRRKIIEWSEFLELHAKVIVLEVPSSTDAFLIFETLNDRGLALSVADLLRSYLFGLAGSRTHEVEMCWEKMESVINLAGDEQSTLDYLRHYWCSWHGATRERDLYRSFRAKIRSPDDAVSTANSLARGSLFYANLLGDYENIWAPSDEFRRGVDTLNILKLNQNRPLLLAAMDQFSESEVSTLIRSLVSLSVRIAISGSSNRSAEKLYCEAAVRIRARKLVHASEVIDFLSIINPNDAELKIALETIDAPNQRLSKYLLLSFEQYVQGLHFPSLVSSKEFAGWDILQIVPPDPSVTPSPLSKLLRRLGNYEIVRKSVKVDEFPLYERFEKTQLQNVIGRSEQQYADSITHRQRSVAAAASSIWRFDEQEAHDAG